ncbi:MAG: GntR family transcriptional regulator [Peptococcaceae bacterium]|nr:GntR family transcriptional regulator [Peptococcaceae bacterium]
MKIQVNIASGIALYEQIASQLKQLIVTGELPEGYPLPSVRALAQELGVSVITTRRAYTELEQEGYVVTTPAKGTFVSHRYTDRLKELGLMRLSELVDDLVYLARSLGVTSEQLAEFVVDHYEYVSANPDEKAKLAQMLRNRRMRF